MSSQKKGKDWDWVVIVQTSELREDLFKRGWTSLSFRGESNEHPEVYTTFWIQITTPPSIYLRKRGGQKSMGEKDILETTLSTT